MKFLERTQTKLLVVCEDGLGGSHYLICAAKKLNLPIVTMPFGVGESADFDRYIENRYKEGSLNIVGRDEFSTAISHYAPNWVRCTPYGDVTPMPLDFILTFIQCGCDILKPWVVHGGLSKYLCVESDAMRDIYVKEKVDVSKFKDTGSCYSDVIYDGINSDERVLSAYENGSFIDPDQPRVLILMPPDYHSERDGEFDDYKTTLEFIVKACKEAHPNTFVALSIHPATTPEIISIIRASGVTISHAWAMEEIPKYDVIFTDFSSMIRWSILAGKPVVNYDIYRFRVRTYESFKSFRSFEKLSEASLFLKQILSSKQAYEDEVKFVKNESYRWGKLDGRNHERITSLFSELIK